MLNQAAKLDIAEYVQREILRQLLAELGPGSAGTSAATGA